MFSVRNTKEIIAATLCNEGMAIRRLFPELEK